MTSSNADIRPRTSLEPPLLAGAEHAALLSEWRAVKATGHRDSTSRPRSKIGALWVIQPTEIRSTPLAATAWTVSTVIRPDASEIARPAITCTASRSMSGVMLSSSTASTPASSASRSCARSSTSHSTLTM